MPRTTVQKMIGLMSIDTSFTNPNVDRVEGGAGFRPNRPEPGAEHGAEQHLKPKWAEVSHREGGRRAPG